VGRLGDLGGRGGAVSVVDEEGKEDDGRREEDAVEAIVSNLWRCRRMKYYGQHHKWAKCAVDNVETDMGNDGKGLSEKGNKDNAELKMEVAGKLWVAQEHW
jgi:hypothetical protein